MTLSLPCRYSRPKASKRAAHVGSCMIRPSLSIERPLKKIETANTQHTCVSLSNGRPILKEEDDLCTSIIAWHDLHKPHTKQVRAYKKAPAYLHTRRPLHRRIRMHSELAVYVFFLHFAYACVRVGCIVRCMSSNPGDAGSWTSYHQEHKLASTREL